MVAVLGHVHSATRDSKYTKAAFTNVTMLLFSKGLLQVHRM